MRLFMLRANRRQRASLPPRPLPHVTLFLKAWPVARGPWPVARGTSRDGGGGTVAGELGVHPVEGREVQVDLVRVVLPCVCVFVCVCVCMCMSVSVRACVSVRVYGRERTRTEH